MSASKSTHSHGAVPSKRFSNRRTRSVCSVSSNTSIRLTAVVEDSFQLSPLPSRMSVLNDRTDIQEPGRELNTTILASILLMLSALHTPADVSHTAGFKPEGFITNYPCFSGDEHLISQSWWRRVGENSRRVTEIMEERDAEVVRTVNVADQFDVDVLSQENENVSVDLPESSDGESIHSIVLERRQMFVQQEIRPVKKTKEFIRNKENLVNSQKSYFDKTNNVNIEQDIDVLPKKLFNAAPKPKAKPAFTAALINASANKTVSKSPEQPAQEVQVRNLFSNRPNAKRKNNFAAFLLSDSEDEIPDVQPRMFGFQKTKGIENHQISKQLRRSVSQSSVRSSVSNMTDVDMEQWKQLPSSTMLEDQFELVGTTPNKTRLSRLSKSRQSGVAKRQSNSINKSRNSNQSHKSDKPNQSKKSNQSNRSNANIHKTEENMEVDEVINENFTLKYDDDDNEEIFDIPGKGDYKNQEQNVADEERKEIQQVENQIQDEILNEKENQKQNESEREIAEENKSEQDIDEENESERDIEEENESKQEIEEKDISEQESEGQNESDQEIEDENDDQENQRDVHVIAEENEVEKEQNQIQDEENKTENQAENKSEHEIIEGNKIDQEYQKEKEKSNEEEINNKNQEDIQVVQIKEKSRNYSDENNIVKESGHNKMTAQECEKMVTENVNNSKDEQEKINQNENVEINISNMEDEQHTEFPEAVLHDKTKHGESSATHLHAQESAKQMNGEIVTNNKDEQENINANKNDQVDSENLGNIEDEQDTKSPEAVLHDKSKRGESFDTHRRRTSTNKSKTMIKDLNIRPSLVPARESIGLTDGSLNSSAEGSGWDSHRTTRKTLRQTFGKDFTPRKSLRTLVMERTAKRQTQNQNNEIADVSKRQPIGLEDRNTRQTNFNDITSKMPLANSTEFPAFESYREDEVSLTPSVKESEKSKMAIVNLSILREPNEEKEQVKNKDDHIDSEQESEQDEDIQLDTEQDEEVQLDTEPEGEIELDIEQDEEIEPDLEQDEEIEPDTKQDEEIEPDTEQNEEIESDEAQEDEELDSHTEQHQTEEIESDSEQSQREEIDHDREHQTKVIESDEEREPDEEMETTRAELVEEYESYREPEETLEESDHEISINLSQDRSLQTNVLKIIKENAEKRRKIEEQVMKSLNQGRKPYNLFKMPEVPKQIRTTTIKKPTKAKPKLSPFFTRTLPPEFLEDMKYKPPKRFTGKNAPWITKRLYKYLEEKLESKYDIRARVRAECLVEKLYSFAKDVRKRVVAPRDAVSDLKREMATLGIVNTHYDFYCFFHDFMPREIRIRVNPDVLNNIPADRRVFGNILSDDEA